MPRTILDVHVLQTVPPSNINRDDTGSPKTAYYGGVRRARVSSQAWKHVVRKAFKDLLDHDQLGVRSKRLVELVADRVQALDLGTAGQDHRAEAEEQAQKAVAATGIKLDKPTRGKNAEAQAAQSGYLVLLARRQIEALAQLAVDAARTGGPVDKKAAKRAADTHHSVDVSLFGRMVADQEASSLSVDAAAQVAHAISVHGVDNEFDYFTAVDDAAPEDNTGAVMIGTVEFNSSTLYRYATLDVDALRANLGDADGDGGATAAAVQAFLRAFVMSMPTGKQNTFANRTLPDAVVVQVRERQGVNLVGAFEDAVTGTAGGGRLAAASQRLRDHAVAVDAAYGGAPVAGWVVRVGTATAPLADLGEQVGLDALITAAGAAVRDRSGVPA